MIKSKKIRCCFVVIKAYFDQHWIGADDLFIVVHPDELQESFFDFVCLLRKAYC